MLIKDIWYTVQNILRDRNITLGKEQFNRYLQFANWELMNTVYGLKGEKDGYETEFQISDELLPFKSTAVIALTSGIGALPALYWHKINMEVTATQKRIRILESREYLRRKNNTVTGPSEDYPICEIKNNSIYILPTTITSVTFTYLRQSNTPEIVLKYENGIWVYDSSVELEWENDKFIDIVRIIVGYLSVPMSPDQVLAYTEQKIKENN